MARKPTFLAICHFYPCCHIFFSFWHISCCGRLYPWFDCGRSQFLRDTNWHVIIVHPIQWEHSPTHFPSMVYEPEQRKSAIFHPPLRFFVTRQEKNFVSRVTRQKKFVARHRSPNQINSFALLLQTCKTLCLRYSKRTESNICQKPTKWHVSRTLSGGKERSV